MLHSASGYWLNEVELEVLSTGRVIGDFAIELEKKGYLIHHVPLKQILKLPRMSTIIKLYLFLKRNKYDVIHIHPERANFLYSILAYITCQKKIIRTVHHIFPMPRTVFWSAIRIIRIIQRKIMSKLLKVKITSNSYSGQENERTEYFSNNRLIFNWYDSNIYKYGYKSMSTPENFNDDNFNIVSLGGNWKYKNYENIIKAFQYLHDIDVHYYIMGPDKENKIKEIIDSCSLQNKVTYLGIVDTPRKYLMSADGYIMASLEEGFGIAAVEAMAVGLPSILSSVKALVDFKKFTNEIIWCSTDPFSISKAIRELVSFDSLTLKTKSKHLSEAMLNNFSIENGAKKFLDIYTEKIK